MDRLKDNITDLFNYCIIKSLIYSFHDFYSPIELIGSLNPIINKCKQIPN